MSTSFPAASASVHHDGANSSRTMRPPAASAAATLTFAQILATLTTAPAERFGVAARVGRLAPGMDADIVVIDGQPERDVSALARVRYTFVKGRLAHAKTS